MIKNINKINAAKKEKKMTKNKCSEMKKENLYELKTRIEAVQDKIDNSTEIVKGSKKFLYFLADVILDINPEIEKLENLKKPSKALETYGKEKDKILTEYCLKDEKGNPKFDINIYQKTGAVIFEMPEDRTAFESKLDELNKEHDFKILNEKFQAGLDEVKIMELEPFKIDTTPLNYDDIPEDVSAARLLTILLQWGLIVKGG